MSVRANAPVAQDRESGHYRHYQGVRPGNAGFAPVDITGCAETHGLIGEGVANTVQRVFEQSGDGLTALGLFISAAREHRRAGCEVCASYLDACRHLLIDVLTAVSE